MPNRLIISAAGSGKTTLLVKSAYALNNEKTLITTYTESNALEIKNKFIELYGCVPEYVTIQTWFSFLIQHGVKPYQSYLFNFRVKGMLLVSKQSGVRYYNQKKFPVYWGENDFEKHYFTSDRKIFSDKLSKLVCRLNDASGNKIIDRLGSIYTNIFIDECQDLAGYDLEIIKLIAESTINLIAVNDPRQVTYLTHHSSKYKKYANGLLKEFIESECKRIPFVIDTKTLSKSFRCNQPICNYANKLFPNVEPCDSENDTEDEHKGVFLIRKCDLEDYLRKFNPVQLRWSRRTNVNDSYPATNFGTSKGLTFDRAIIYPTNEMLKWMKDFNHNLKNEGRCKFYVALTRARHSVGIICDDEARILRDGIELYTP